MTEITPADIRRNAAWIFTDVARQLLNDPDDFGGLSDETVALLDRFGRVAYGIVETLADRDDAAAHAADGRARPRRVYMEISPEDAEHLVAVIDQMFDHAGDRKSAAFEAAHKPRAVA
ncbi:hypothetical protein UG55_103519 [Frankia sp. EI5c]|uniref:hypothetical protein n=1 Tax=Frankia sp. EI5c TaxID=683316 RepID=UPI0007C3D9AF|nr:hypothetical protein [Frankia sp. EI5c]OAA23585.1 hypothetical protein UG55_103519 [Frankia sp. EI5c]